MSNTQEVLLNHLESAFDDIAVTKDLSMTVISLVKQEDKPVSFWVASPNKGEVIKLMTTALIRTILEEDNKELNTQVAVSMLGMLGMDMDEEFIDHATQQLDEVRTSIRAESVQ